MIRVPLINTGLDTLTIWENSSAVGRASSVSNWEPFKSKAQTSQKKGVNDLAREI